jgi:hypothetical protein
MTNDAVVDFVRCPLQTTSDSVAGEQMEHKTTA